MNKSSNLSLAIGPATLFKLFLLAGIVFISLVFIWYTLDVIAQLEEDAQGMVTSYVKLWRLAASDASSGGEVQIIFEEVIKKANFPVIIADVEKNPVFWRNIPGVVDNDPSEEALIKVSAFLEDMKKDKEEIPLTFGETVISYFYYGDSPVIRQLQWMPFVEIALVLAFITVGLVGFYNIKRSEERHIWVGMAKEAAHQLGTPISSLMGWLELLGGQVSDIKAASICSDDIFKQMKIDVERLQRVANRFGQIGSVPELVETDVNLLLEETTEYFRRRLPFGGSGTKITVIKGEIPRIYMNRGLFTWALENLIKNSLQAVDSQSGEVRLTTLPSRNPRFIIIEAFDNGRGITAGVARKVFRPGFTTKKRGWGLGLTLSRRIVEDYHRGQITLLRSHPGETVFQMILPVKKDDAAGGLWYNLWTKRSL